MRRETHPAPAGRKSATVVARGGQKFDVWPEQLANFQVGAKYDIDVSERTFKGRTYQSITKATPANGAAKPTTNGSATGTTAHTDSEPQFVATVLAALVMKGEVVNNKRQLFEATNMLRGLWGATFGGQHSNGGTGVTAIPFGEKPSPPSPACGGGGPIWTDLPPAPDDPRPRGAGHR